MTHRRALLACLLLMTVGSFAAWQRTGKQTTRKAAPAARRAAASAKPERPPAATGDRAVAQAWMRGMTLRDKVAQMVVIHSFGEMPPARSKDYKNFVRLVRDLHVGGVTVVNRTVRGSVRSAEPYAMAAFLNRMQRMAKVPLITSADFERGASMRVTGTVKYPHLMTYGAADDPEMTKALGAATAREARAMGIHWVFAPAADVNNNPDNPIINIRSFGEDPNLVARHVEAFIEGAHSAPGARVLVTAKHFPGHGDTAVDSHMGLASLEASRERIQSVEMIPFRAAVKAGVDSIMTAHMAVPAYEPERVPATVSKKVLTGLIRDDLDYRGLIVTDAMDMQGLTKEFPGGEAAVRAVQAGVDVLLMPTNPEEVINSLVAAVKSKRISQKRIEESVMRILMAKARLGLHRRKLVNLESISDTIEAPELAEAAQAAADRGVTVVRNEGDVLPLQRPDQACYWILTENRYGIGGRQFQDEIRSRAANAQVQLLDPQMPQIEIDDLMSKAGACSAHVVAAFNSVGAYRGGVGLRGNYPAFVERLIGGGAPVVLVSLGNPYLLRNFPGVAAYMATFSPVASAETAAVKALFGEIPVSGKMPVSIPGMVQAGQGIAIPAVAGR